MVRKYASSTTSGVAPRYAGYLRGLDRASRDLVPSERAIMRSFSAEVYVPTVDHSTPEGVSFYSGIRTEVAGSPASSVFWYRPLAVSGDYAWLTGDAYAATVLTSSEGEYIYEDPKFYRTVCQGGSRCVTVAATEYEATRQSLNGAVTGLTIMSATSGTLLAKTVISQTGLFSPEAGSYSVGFDDDREAVVKRFRLNAQPSPAEGAFYLFDQGHDILANGYHRRATPATLRLFFYPASSGYAASQSSTATLRLTQFYDEVDLSLFESASGTRHGNGYALGDLLSKFAEKVCVETSTVRVAGFGATSVRVGMDHAVAGFASAPEAGTNRVYVSKGVYLDNWDASPPTEAEPWSRYQSTAGHYAPAGYGSYMVDTDTAAEAVAPGSLLELYYPTVGRTESSMYVMAGGSHEAGSSPETQTGVDGVLRYLSDACERLSFSTATVSQLSFTLAAAAVACEAACLTNGGTVYSVGGLQRYVRSAPVSVMTFKDYSPYVATIATSTGTAVVGNGELTVPRGCAALFRNGNSDLWVVGGRGPACVAGARQTGVVDVAERVSMSTGTTSVDHPPAVPIAATCGVQDSSRGWCCGGVTEYQGFRGWTAAGVGLAGLVDTDLVQGVHMATATWQVPQARMVNRLSYSSASSL